MDDIDVVNQKGGEGGMTDDQKPNPQGNKIYPSTDIDDGNVSNPNVGPGGLTSADENDTSKQSAKVSKIQIVGYDQNGNPTSTPADDSKKVAMQDTIDLDP